MRSFNEIINEELSRELKQSDGNNIKFVRRLVQELAQAALKGNVRANEIILKFYREHSIEVGKEKRELRQIGFEYKAHYEAVFAEHRASKLPPPDILPHPDHVVVDENGAYIRGPVEPEERKRWGFLKLHIRDTAGLCADLREELRKNPQDSEARACLEDAERERRKLMRKVPKGWKWTEKIFSLDNDPEELIAWSIRKREEKSRG